ncbi:Mitochondrial inner membrane protease subunit 2, partial [Nibea albiflora]
WFSRYLCPVQVMAQQASAGRRYLRAFVSGFFVAVPVTVTVLDRFAYVARVEGASMQLGENNSCYRGNWFLQGDNGFNLVKASSWLDFRLQVDKYRDDQRFSNGDIKATLTDRLNDPNSGRESSAAGHYLVLLCRHQNIPMTLSARTLGERSFDPDTAALSVVFMI